MKLFHVTEEYITYRTVEILALNSEEAMECVIEGLGTELSKESDFRQIFDVSEIILDDISGFEYE